MKHWYVVLLVLVLSGCGAGSSTPPQELDSDTTTNGRSPSNKDLLSVRSTLGAGAAPYKFNINEFDHTPAQHNAILQLSSHDTFDISLTTLSNFTEKTRFSLIQAEKILHQGMPTVIAPTGYTVELEIADDQVIAIIQSNTQPIIPSTTVLFDTPGNDIIVGDLSSVTLLMAGTHKDLGIGLKGNIGLEVYKSNDQQHQYVSYGTSHQWFGQLSKSYTGADTVIGIQCGHYWDWGCCGKLNVGAQNLYWDAEGKSINNASLKYITNIPSSSYQGQVMFATTFDNNHTTAIGVGLIFNPLQGGTLRINAVITELLWEMSISGSLDL